jgi:hypothetical protein
MRRLLVPIVAAALVTISTTGAIADPTELGTEFTGTLAFGACPVDQPYDLGCGEPRVVEPFTDPRLEGDVAITGWSGGYGASSVVWFGSWLIGDSEDGWVELASPRQHARDGTATQYTSLLVGTGVNEGLFALSQVTVTDGAFDFEGRIVRGDLPAMTDYSGVLVPGDLGALDW